MPSRNTVKEFADDQYYHLYNRGVEKRDIFLDDQDYVIFLGLLKKYLTGQGENKKNRHKYTNFAERIELLSFCLMPNHFHLLLYQKDKDAITQFMRRVMTGYSMYFNDRYNRVGSLFQGRYKASRINADDYLHHISRYIHLNPKDYEKWPYSSFKNYTGEKKTKWVKTDTILGLFDNDKQSYVDFVSDYVSSRNELSVIKWQLANGSDLQM